jgi:hypothetical protein
MTERLSSAEFVDQSNVAAAALRDRLLYEDVAINRAAIALCWDARPAYIDSDGYDRDQWWGRQGAVEQRLYRRRARIAIEEWELAHG